MLATSQELNSGAFHGVGSLVQHYVYCLRPFLGLAASCAYGDLICSPANQSPFGKIIAIKNGNGGDVTDAPLVDNFYTFTGREYDKESGLYYFRARYLDSETGRFIQSDPHPGAMRAPSSFNSKYAYVSNNPARYVDPNGEMPVILAGILIGAAIGGIVSGLQNDWNLRAVLTGMAAGAVAGGLVATGAFFGAGAGAGGAGSAGAGAGIFGGGAAGGAAGGAIGGGLSSWTSAWITGSKWTWGSFLLSTTFGAIGGGVYGARIGTAASAVVDVDLNVGTNLNLSPTPLPPPAAPSLPKPSPAQRIPDPNFDRLFQLH